MTVTAVTEATFADDVMTSQQLVVVDYWADWCSPCKQMAPILDELAAAYDGRAKFVKVDTNDQPGLAAQQGIMSLPTLELWKDGRIVKSLTGGKSKNALTKVIDEFI